MGIRVPSPILLVEDIPATLRGSTGAVIFFGRIAVIIGQFLAGFDMPQSDNPQCFPGLFDRTVGVTGMVDIAGGILQPHAINIVALIELKDIRITRG